VAVLQVVFFFGNGFFLDGEVGIGATVYLVVVGGRGRWMADREDEESADHPAFCLWRAVSRRKEEKGKDVLERKRCRRRC
jgi:hypothetical protein